MSDIGKEKDDSVTNRPEDNIDDDLYDTIDISNLDDDLSKLDDLVMKKDKIKTKEKKDDHHVKRKKENKKSKKRNNLIMLLMIVMIVFIIFECIYYFVFKKDNIFKLAKHDGREIVVYREVSNKKTVKYLEAKDRLDDKNITYEKVGKYQCRSKECTFVGADSKYVVVSDGDYYYLGDITKNSELRKIGEATVSSDVYLFKNSKLKIVAYALRDNLKVDYIYNIEESKKYNKVKYDVYYNEKFYLYESLLIDNKLIALTSDEKKIILFNFKTGKIVLNVEGNTLSLIGDDKDTYILINNSNDISVFDLNGKAIFNRVFEDIDYNNGKFIAKNNNSFNVYNQKGNLVKTGQQYYNVLKIIKDYIIVLNGNNLQILDTSENVVATLCNDYSNVNNEVNLFMSGWKIDSSQEGIYIYVIDKRVTANEYLKEHPEMADDDLTNAIYGYEYYYIPATKQMGKQTYLF